MVPDTFRSNSKTDAYASRNVQVREGGGGHRLLSQPKGLPLGRRLTGTGRAIPPKDCGTGYCVHNRQKRKCKDCGTGHCAHGREKSKRKDCGTGH